nr:PREDICTED: uncharacterized protein LOC107397890 isoform X2 [Tribolium castaneum]|eukprot:XP_015835232.1 PREDICTED: uncharacterized protein LOC107397890 isoform X2 [Tribolium castaneum]
MAFDASKNNYLEMCLILYDLSGLRASSKPFLKFIALYTLYPLMLIVCAMIHVNIWFKHGNIFEITEVFTSICIIASITIRKTVLIYYGPLYEDVIQQHSQFWDYGLFGKTTELRLRKNMKFCVFLIKCFLTSGIASIVVRSISPLFVKDILLPQECWIPGNNPVALKVIYVLEILFYLESTTYFPLFDGLYLIMTGNLKSQLILLQKAVESVDLVRDDDEISWRKLKKCCQHHKLLLSVLKKINKIYSVFFLCTYVLTIIGICLPLFVIFNKSSTFTQVVESVLVANIMNTLLIMICIPGSEIEIEAERLITQIYNINWHETSNLKIRP